MRKFLAGVLTALVATTAQAGPIDAGLVYQGMITKVDGTPLVAPSVTFRMQITSPGAESCVLYDEYHSVDMSNSQGVFNLTVGKGDPNFNGNQNPSSALSLGSIFDNSKPKTGLACASGNSFTPNSVLLRTLKVSFFDGSVWTNLKPATITAAPYAEHAQTLQGLGKEAFLQVNSTSSKLTQAGLESVFSTDAMIAELIALANGASEKYLKVSGTDPVNFAKAPVSATAPVQATELTNKSYVDSNLGGKSIDATVGQMGASDSGKVISWDGMKWISALIPQGLLSSDAISGDLSGTFADPKVAKIQGTSVSTTSPVAGQVLKMDASGYAPGFIGMSDVRSSVGMNAPFFPTNCTTSQVMTYSSVTDTMVCSSIGTLSAASLPAFSGDVTSAAGSAALTLANSGVTAGEYTRVTVDAKGRVTSAGAIRGTDLPAVLGYSGGSQGYMQFTKPAFDEKGRLMPLFSSSLAASDIPALDASKITTGQLAPLQMPAFQSGDVVSNAGTNVLNLSAISGLAAGTYGSATAIPVITVDGKGRVTAVSTQAAGGGGTTADDATLLENASLVSTSSGGDLTISLKTASGDDPSVTSPVRFAVRKVNGGSPSATNTSYIVRSITAPLSVTIPAASTLGTIQNNPYQIFVYLMDHPYTQTAVLGVSRNVYNENHTASVYNNTFGTGGDPWRMYTNSGIANVSMTYRMLGRVRGVKQASANTWQAPYSVAVGSIGDMTVGHANQVFRGTQGTGGKQVVSNFMVAPSAPRPVSIPYDYPQSNTRGFRRIDTHDAWRMNLPASGTTTFNASTGWTLGQEPRMECMADGLYQVSATVGLNGQSSTATNSAVITIEATVNDSGGGMWDSITNKWFPTTGSSVTNYYMNINGIVRCQQGHSISIQVQLSGLGSVGHTLQGNPQMSVHYLGNMQIPYQEGSF